MSIQVAQHSYLFLGFSLFLHYVVSSVLSLHPWRITSSLGLLWKRKKYLCECGKCVTFITKSAHNFNWFSLEHVHECVRNMTRYFMVAALSYISVAHTIINKIELPCHCRVYRFSSSSRSPDGRNNNRIVNLIDCIYELHNHITWLEKFPFDKCESKQASLTVWLENGVGYMWRKCASKQYWILQKRLTIIVFHFIRIVFRCSVVGPTYNIYLLSAAFSSSNK